MNAYQIRPATLDDADVLFRIHRATMGPYLAQVPGPWSDESGDWELHLAWLREGRAEVVLCGGQSAGLVDIDWRPDMVRVNRIGIDPAFQGRGLGTAVLRDVLRQCQERGLPAQLEVFPFNPARELYQRLGFQEVGTDGPSIVMEWHPGTAEDRSAAVD